MGDARDWSFCPLDKLSHFATWAPRVSYCSLRWSCCKPPPQRGHALCLGATARMLTSSAHKQGTPQAEPIQDPALPTLWR